MFKVSHGGCKWSQCLTGVVALALLLAVCKEAHSMYVTGGCKWWQCVRRSGACHPAARGSVCCVCDAISCTMYLYYVLVLCTRYYVPMYVNKVLCTYVQVRGTRYKYIVRGTSYIVLRSNYDNSTMYMYMCTSTMLVCTHVRTYVHMYIVLCTSYLYSVITPYLYICTYVLCICT